MFLLAGGLFGIGFINVTVSFGLALGGHPSPGSEGSGTPGPLLDPGRSPPVVRGPAVADGFHKGLRSRARPRTFRDDAPLVVQPSGCSGMHRGSAKGSRLMTGLRTGHRS